MSVKNWIKYYRNSFADGELLDIKNKDSEVGNFFNSYDDLDQRNLIDLYNNLNKLTKTKKPQSESDNDEDEAFPINVFIAPFYLQAKTNHNKPVHNSQRAFPFWIPASLDKDGELKPLGKGNKLPWVVRSMLNPLAYSGSNLSPVIADIKDVDKVLDSYIFNFDSWHNYWHSSESFFEKVTGSNFEKFEVDNYVTNNQICIIKAKDIVSLNNILFIYDSLKNTSTIPDLISNLLSFKDRERKPLPDDKDLFLYKGHYGQYNNQFPLSNSQRKSLLVFENESKGNILAVNGPPGTGKTTLLQSVVANEVVKAALSGRNTPPKIIASSTNNQATTNILDSFGSTNENLERWLPKLSSLGSYLISSDSVKQNAAAEKGYQILTRSKDELVGFYFSDLHKSNSKELEKYYISCYSKNYNTDSKISVRQITELLKSTIVKAAKKIDLILETINQVNKAEAEAEHFPLDSLPELKRTIESLNNNLKSFTEEKENLLLFRDKYNEFLSANKLTLFFSFVPAINKRYIRKLGLLLIDSPSDDLKNLTSNRAVESVLLTSLQTLDNHIVVTKSDIGKNQGLYNPLYKLKTEFDSQVNELSELWEIYLDTKKPDERAQIEKESKDLDFFEKANRILDVSLRYTAFVNAIHYWEGLWILKQQSDKLRINNDLASRENIFNRISYLTPLFISTFHSLPAFCLKEGSRPIYDLFDLIIVDEAGQVSPEVGVAAFCLAEKALVVGDIHQIKPVWNIAYEKIDAGNLKEAGLLKELVYEKLKKLGILCSSGNLMHLAQRVSNYEINENLGGTLLTEHRRCVDELVSFSNHFVYDDMLKPMVGSSKGTHFKGDNIELFLPPLSYLNIRGSSEKKSGSTFNKREAESIAKWIQQYGTLILAYYNKGKSDKEKKRLKDCLAVITPFGEQRNEIYRQFSEYKIDTDITVGTVHALQGAERPIIIFSPSYGINQSNNQLFFDSGYNMLNVALTRAKHHFIVMGNMALFNPLNKEKPSGGLANYLFADDINELSTSFLFDKKNIVSENRVDSLEKHQNCLKRAFEVATKRVVIVSPFISIHAITADNLLPEIQKAVLKNIEIHIYTDMYLDMPNGKLKKSSKDGRKALVEAGAKLDILNGIHNKAIAIDEDVLIEGSFNWLSALRDKHHPHYRYDVSQILQGKEAKQQIIQLLKELALI